MVDKELVEVITARVLQRLSPPGSAASSERVEEDRHPFHSFAAEVRACATTAGKARIPVGVSARHCHVTQAHLDVLYGPGHRLRPHAELYQPGEFAAREVVTVVGPRMRALENVRILGPLRPYTQVELSRTDCVFLGVEAPIRESGNLDDAVPVTIAGPKGSLCIKAAICPTRHIHLNPRECEYYGVRNQQIVQVRISGPRALTFENVRIRMHPNVIAQMHLDTDDANAAGLRGGEGIELILC
jgi:putative phosphotransacetylase